MAPMLLFAALMLASLSEAAADDGIGGQSGFVSIDCGREANYSDYKDPKTGIVYVSDEPYIDAGAGENHRISATATATAADSYLLQTLRSFPSGPRNCYALPTVAGTKYLVRLGFLYGNYDGENSSSSSASSLRFDLHLGAQRWATVDDVVVQTGGISRMYEVVFMGWARWAPACLVNVGGGTPFVSSVELRPIDDELYPSVKTSESLSLFKRSDMGADTTTLTRYPADEHDRIWKGTGNPGSTDISTQEKIQSENSFEVPLPVLQTAITTPGGNDTTLTVAWQDTRSSSEYMVFLHFADFQKIQPRQFNVTLNDIPIGSNGRSLMFSPSPLDSSSVYSSDGYRADDGNYNLVLRRTAASALPPMLNAMEIYTVITHDSPRTFHKDFDAIMDIKYEYGIKKNWMGDPCFPSEFIWDGIKCSTAGDDNTSRIISLDLSQSNLQGVVSINFTFLTALNYLNLSGNQLNGPVPDSLCKNIAGLYIFSYTSDGDICNNRTSSSRSTNRSTTILAISIVTPVLAVAILLAFLLWRAKGKHNGLTSFGISLISYNWFMQKPVSTFDPPRVPDPKKAPGSTTDHWSHLPINGSRQFTYEELKNFTLNFQRFIGQGGFGHVYYGCLEDGSEVAVKMRSESSLHGLDEFLAEVQSLTKVHHRNLVSLVGYCWEEHYLALVYEYMPSGSLCDHLRGKRDVGETLNWAKRVRIMLEAAQGLEYLHKGCNLPIIHGDVKTNNVLLGENLKAKLADFGLSKMYISDSQTHISVTAAGTVGYIDPEYYQTGRLTESSDVYSFGVVLLEVVTGELPILAGHGHIVQRVERKVTSGSIGLVADARLNDSYDISSMWKVVDTAMLCTTDVAIQRPTMSTVVLQLKECLALEEAREDRNRAGPTNDAVDVVSTFGPSAR
ncbi:Os09g0353200 [Oryza sativa Japonica Group]|uniref:Os09g0353200 protein n=1 Tax=Oryza sativa subsp. japonica TaxID=39947 RepID=Q6EQM5_ORYSJ|nr:probable protein kinase-like [Oryza sativa Japonica Group]BAF24873.2 Os09g0353200 [Oryza sativa Japonica Group]|eukprot:NP_001062959.2 Os09g0353200 [Oryza sativa Japonica Group]